MDVTKTAPHLTSGRLLARNTIWNLLGQLLPIAAGVVCFPFLVRGLGNARFGILSIAWVVIGYFSLFDLGLGRALTKLVADKIGADEEHSIPPLVWTSLSMMLVLGVLGGAAMFALSPWLTHQALKIPAPLQAEALRSFYLLALSIPLVTLTSGLRGILEAQQRFRILNLIRIPMSLFQFLGPLMVLPFSHSLVTLINVLVAGRFIGGVAHMVACFRVVPALRNNFSLQRGLVVPLLRVGGWMTISNIVGPAIQYMDRFLIGAMLSVGAVTYYTVPFDTISRLIVIPVATAGVLFPAFAVSIAQVPNRTALLLSRGVKYVFLSLFPVALVIMALAPEILRLWLGIAFAENSATVLRWLTAGIFMNCLAVVPFAFLQGIGRADTTGKLMSIEFPLWLIAAYVLIAHLGIEGAAIAWTVRATIETVILFIMSRHFLPTKTFSPRPLAIGAIAATSALYLATLPSGSIGKGIFLFGALLAFAFAGWFLALRREERLFLTSGRLGLEIVDSD